MMDKVPKKKTMSVNFSRAFPLLDFLTLEDGTIRLSQNVTNYHSCCAISQKSRGFAWQFGDAGLGLTPNGPVQSNPVWRSPVRHFIHEFKTSHI